MLRKSGSLKKIATYLRDQLGGADGWAEDGYHPGYSGLRGSSGSFCVCKRD